jgi:RNA polymerase sigma-70 factor (ECF subfamily)
MAEACASPRATVPVGNRGMSVVVATSSGDASELFADRPRSARRGAEWMLACSLHSPVARLLAVNPKRASDGHEEATTLGDLLYADRSGASPAEEDWVRVVRSIAAGDQQAMRDLYERTHRLVFTLAMRICSNREIAEEITLDVFHDVWRRSSQYDPEGGPVVGWIMNQARSRAIDRLRFEQRKKRVAPDPSHREEQVEVSEPANIIDAQQRRGLLRDALTALTPDERQAIEVAFFSELTYAEAAVRLDQPLGTVKTRVRSALIKLRKVLGTKEGEA